MKTNKEHRAEESCRESCRESGNALIYVLIAIVLFAALSFTLSRQTDTGEAGVLPDNRAELYATQLISYAAQVKSALDQMVFSGARINNLDFRDPSAADFNAGTQKARSNRVFHPEGGGLTRGRLPEDALDSNPHSNPAPGWYLGRFNNVEWTPSAGNDVILSAFQINEAVCAKINEKITGSSNIPEITTAFVNSLFVDAALHSGANFNFLTDPSGSPHCSDCHEMSSMCVVRPSDTTYVFYTIILAQ